MTSATEHRTVVELLPWYVNGTLPEAERVSVERHLRGCLSCRAALKDERTMAAALRQEASADFSMERNFERLMGRIEPRRRWRPGFGALLGRMPPRIVAPAAVALVLVLGGAVLWLSAGREGTLFSTATSAAPEMNRNIDIIFAPGVSDAQIRDVLASIQGTIVGGPSDIGRYTVRLSGRGLSDAKMRALIERLDKDERVRFAGRSFIEVPKK